MRSLRLLIKSQTNQKGDAKDPLQNSQARHAKSQCVNIELSFLKNTLFIFREGGRRQVEREGEKHQCVVASSMAPTGDLAHNPGMCPAWESNQ